MNADNYCQACNKTFASANVFMHHRKGKKHIRAVNEMAKNKQKQGGAQSEFSESQIVKLKTIAYLETWLQKLSVLLAPWVVATVNQVRKRQTSSYDELAADQHMRIQQGSGLINFQRDADNEEMENLATKPADK